MESKLYKIIIPKETFVIESTSKKQAKMDFLKRFNFREELKLKILENE